MRNEFSSLKAYAEKAKLLVISLTFKNVNNSVSPKWKWLCEKWKACTTLMLAIHGSLSSRLSFCREEVGSASQNSGTIKKITVCRCDLWTENKELSKILYSTK